MNSWYPWWGPTFNAIFFMCVTYRRQSTEEDDEWRRTYCITDVTSPITYERYRQVYEQSFNFARERGDLDPFDLYITAIYRSKAADSKSSRTHVHTPHVSFSIKKIHDR